MKAIQRIQKFTKKYIAFKKKKQQEKELENKKKSKKLDKAELKRREVEAK
jgi:hypothetical protein